MTRSWHSTDAPATPHAVDASPSHASKAPVILTVLGRGGYRAEAPLAVRCGVAAARVDAAPQGLGAAAATDSRRVLVTVKAGHRRQTGLVEEAVAAGIGAPAVDDQDPWPPGSDGPGAVRPDRRKNRVRLNPIGCTDPVGRLLFNVLAMVAEFESDLIRMRTRRA